MRGVLLTVRVRPEEGPPGPRAYRRGADAEVGAPRGQSLAAFAGVGEGHGLPASALAHCFSRRGVLPTFRVNHWLIVSETWHNVYMPLEPSVGRQIDFMRYAKSLRQ